MEEIDNMTIKSSFTTKLVSRFLTKILEKKLKIKGTVNLKSADILVKEQHVIVQVNGFVMINKDSIMKLLRAYNFEEGET